MALEKRTNKNITVIVESDGTLVNTVVDSKKNQPGDICLCGEPATCFMDMDGDPLPEPLCHDCFFEQHLAGRKIETDEHIMEWVKNDSRN